MGQSNYDECARHLNRQTEGEMTRWFLRMNEDELVFHGWLDSLLFMPGGKQRLVDAIADLRDVTQHGFPFAGLTEFQTRPDIGMPGRMLIAGGLCDLTLRPTKHPGDRFGLCAIVVNLTGKGNAERLWGLGEGLWWLKPVERNLAEYDAMETLNDIIHKRAPREAMAFVSLMRGGSAPAVRELWMRLFEEEKDLTKRGDLAMVVVFAELTQTQTIWEETLRSKTMIESPMVRRWKDEARVQTKAESVVQFLRARNFDVSEELALQIRAVVSIEHLDRMIQFAATAASLDDFQGLAFGAQ